MRGLIARALALLALATPLAAPAQSVGGGGSVRAVQPLRVVAAAQRSGNGWTAAPSGKLSFVFQDQNVLGGPIASLRPAFLPWTDNNSVDTQNSAAVTITAAWIECIASGQVVPVTFGGARTLTMAAGGSVVRYLADEIPASAWTNPACAARGAVLRSTGKGSVPAAGNNVPRSRYKSPSLAGSNFAWFDAMGDTTGIDYAGAMVVPTGATTVNRGFSLVLAGRFAAAGYVALGGIGDSIADGILESGAQTATGQGPIEQINFINPGSVSYMAAVIPSYSQAIATLLAAQSGEPYPTVANIGNWSLRAQLLGELTNVLIDEMGTNNFQAASSGNATNTPAAVQIRAEAVWAYLRSFKPGLPILKTKLLPVTNSSPIGGPTKASQTPAYDWVSGGRVDQWHALLTTARNGGKIDAFMDIRAPVSDPTDEHYWISNGTPNYYTGENGTDPTPLIHPYAQTSNLMAPVIRPAVVAYEGRVQ